MFRLSAEEAAGLSRQPAGAGISSQIVMRSPARRGKSYLPYAFTEQGVAMLSGVLRSPRAVQVNVGIMRAFVHLRRLLLSHADLARQLAEMEKKQEKSEEQKKTEEKGCTEPLYGEKAKCIIQIVPQSKKCKTFNVHKQCMKRNLTRKRL